MYLTNLLLAAVLAQSIATAAVYRPANYVAFVSFDGQRRCTYQTGDVIFESRQFEDDLKNDRFDKGIGLLIFYYPETAGKCLKTARKIASRVGFREVRVEVAPKNLDMGPPRT